MIGKQITVHYFDQNAQMEGILPRSGTILRSIKSEDWGDDWYLVKLGEPFNYFVEADSNPERLEVDHLLIKSRWEGVTIESGEETSVFVLLVPDLSVLDRKPFHAKELPYVCWGMVNLEQNRRASLSG
jgi:hypothetical protein